MISEIQKRKFHHFFNVLDFDKNGCLQPEDFVNIGRRIIEARSIDASSRRAQLILVKSHQLYIQLLADSDNPELSVTLYDWIEFFRLQLIKDVGNRILEYYIHRISRHIFDLFDANRDQLISKEEYTHMLTVYQISEGNCARGFKEIDTNNDGFISSEEMINGLRNFFMSNNLDAPGNRIFGEWS
ncbi:MAG: EF-hand domain-containing protein [Bacteroidota bacterium]